MKPTRLVSLFVLAAGAIAAVGIALTFGAAPLEVAKIAVPHQLVLKAAQIGFLASAAHAAPVGSETGYLPARLAAQGDAQEPHLPQF